MKGRHLKALIPSMCVSLLVGMMPAVDSYAAGASYFYACAYDDCYIYEEADQNSIKIAFVPEGGVCRVIGEDGSYVKVFSGGYTGYMKASWLDNSDEILEDVTSQDGIAADKDISIYAEPDAGATVLAERKAGATEPTVSTDDLDVWGSKDGWIEITYVTDSSGNKEHGWVKESEVSYARIVTDAEPYMGEPEGDDGILIASSDDLLIKEADQLREKATVLRTSLKKESNRTNQKETVRPGVLNRHNGTVLGPSGKETYYNLNMSSVVRIMRKAGFSEEEYPYWIREDGCKMLGSYIMCAADLNLRPRGSLVESSLGTCIVADTGDFIYANPTQIDIAVAW